MCLGSSVVSIGDELVIDGKLISRKSIMPQKNSVMEKCSSVTSLSLSSLESENFSNREKHQVCTYQYYFVVLDFNYNFVKVGLF